MITPKIEVKDEAVIARMKKIAAAGADLSKPLNSIGQLVVGSVMKNFEVGGRFESAGSWRGGNTRWKDLAASTKAARARKGAWPGPILDVSGDGGLPSSVSSQVQGNAVTVGTNKPYGAIHQFGGLAGPKDRRVRVTIPARPYLVVQDDDVEDIIDILDKHIAKQ